ncbi:uncharacterized protein LOC134710265 [Mytilus trossulus]|uniref:uncharacterized protein LOC134710265 n=1 Tax=Mytilus trossulus TaxID=6551 RepID=UPI0030058D79
MAEPAIKYESKPGEGEGEAFIQQDPDNQQQSTSGANDGSPGTGTGTKSRPKKIFEDGIASVKENKVFSVCVGVDIVLILVIFAVTLAWLNFAQTEIVDFDPASEMYCMKCEYVQASAAEKAKYFPNAEQVASGKCCAIKEGYMKDRLKKKVEKTLNEEYREKPLFQLCLNSTTAEHPKGYGQIRSVSQAQGNVLPNLYLIKWDFPPSNPDPDTFLEQVVYDNTDGYYQVKRAGYYHIYSNLVFEFKKDNSTNVTPAESVIRHLVLKYRKEYNIGEKFLEGYSTLCPNTGDTTWNSFVFGNFYLETTDKVKVFVNNPGHLAIKGNSPGGIEKATSYFGMYLI